MKLHYSQTYEWMKRNSIQFQYLMKLHYSQTASLLSRANVVFQYLMKLHYSQTHNHKNISILEFQYLMKLHYSQTTWFAQRELKSFSTLWNYTTLKQFCSSRRLSIVSVPYEITLLSNPWQPRSAKLVFQYLMKLHYSQTSNKLRHYNAQGNNIRYIYYTI